MKTRGPIIGIIGIIIIVISIVMVVTIFPANNPTMGGEILLPNLLEDMFDTVSDEVLIMPGESNSFSFTSMDSEVQLLWGLQVLEYKQGDKFSVAVSNSLGDELSKFDLSGPILFDSFEIPKTDIYSFEVRNLGPRPIAVMMMFSEDPDNSAAFSDPNSPLMTTLLPLAVSGILLIIGIIVVIFGFILFLMDWKKSKNESKYY